MRYLKPIIILATVFCTALPLSGAYANGLYLGAGVGEASIEDSPGNPAGTPFNESDVAWKAYLGYRFDVLPIVSLSAEGGYRDLGKPSTAAAEYSVKGFDYGALVGIGLGPIELFARAGGMEYELDKKVVGTTFSFDGSTPVFGAGVRFNLLGAGVRAEYEQIDIDELDKVEMISVSVFYQW